MVSPRVESKHARNSTRCPRCPRPPRRFGIAEDRACRLREKFIRPPPLKPNSAVRRLRNDMRGATGVKDREVCSAHCDAAAAKKTHQARRTHCYESAVSVDLCERADAFEVHFGAAPCQGRLPRQRLHEGLFYHVLRARQARERKTEDCKKRQNAVVTLSLANGWPPCQASRTALRHAWSGNFYQGTSGIYRTPHRRPQAGLLAQALTRRGGCCGQKFDNKGSGR